MTRLTALSLPCLTAALLLASVDSSSACPADASTPCIATTTVSSDAPPAPHQPVLLAAQISEIALARLPEHQVTLLAAAALQPDAPAPDLGEAGEMPWIWQILRTEVYDALPSIEEDKRFNAVLAPVVITSPTETTPGVGMRGDF